VVPNSLGLILLLSLFRGLMSEPNPQTRRRSQRVLLQVAVLVRTELPDGKRVQTQAFTESVNAHGGLLESPVKITTSQKITLVNPQTQNEVGCRVVRTERSPEASYAIAFEFDRPNPKFWHINFPPEDWGVMGDAATDTR
jgi:hypothetical protein